MIKFSINIIVLLSLFIGNIIFEDYTFFSLIYVCIFFYHIFIIFSINKRTTFKATDIKNYIFISVFLFIITYFIICDSNPFFLIIVFYSFYPNFIKATFIVFIHTYFLNKFINNKTQIIINFDFFSRQTYNYKRKNYN